jgi:hypothetical protein
LPLLATVAASVFVLGPAGGVRAIHGCSLVVAVLAAVLALTVITARVVAAPVVGATLEAYSPLLREE